MKKEVMFLTVALALSAGTLGQKAAVMGSVKDLADVLISGVKVYINDVQVTGYEIDGYVYLSADELAALGFDVQMNQALILADDFAKAFGTFTWDDALKELRITADTGVITMDTAMALPDGVSTVSIVRSNTENAFDITRDEIESMVAEALAGTNFTQTIQNGQTVVLKPNLVQLSMPPSNEFLPDEANGITTDWRITAAVAKQVRALNPDGKIYVMEGSSGGSTEFIMDYYHYTKEYIPEVDEFLAMESANGEWRDYNSALIKKVSLPDGRLHHEYYFNKIVYEADVLISLPTLKTSSGGIVMTGSIKNVSIGMPPGNIYNVSPENNTKFDMVSHDKADGDLDNWIYDYYMARPITFAVVDALQGYQKGPNAFSDGSYEGNLMNMRVIMAGSDAVAVDSVGSRLAGWEPESVGYLSHFKESGIGAVDVSDIYVTGEKVDELRKPFAVNDEDLGGVAATDGQAPEFEVSVTKENGFYRVTLKSEDAVKAEVYTDKIAGYGILKDNTYTFAVADGVAKVRVVVYDRAFNKSEKEIEIS